MCLFWLYANSEISKYMAESRSEEFLHWCEWKGLTGQSKKAFSSSGLVRLPWVCFQTSSVYVMSGESKPVYMQWNFSHIVHPASPLFSQPGCSLYISSVSYCQNECHTELRNYIKVQSVDRKLHENISCPCLTPHSLVFRYYFHGILLHEYCFALNPSLCAFFCMSLTALFPAYLDAAGTSTNCYHTAQSYISAGSNLWTSCFEHDWGLFSFLCLFMWSNNNVMEYWYCLCGHIPV
jgi:hypothetical protein